MSNVAINIAAEFTGKNAFKKAETSVDKLNKSTKQLSKTFGRAFGTAAVLAFGKASVKAFAEDDKAATALGTTLKNLNLAYGSNIGTVNGYINRLEAQTGVLDDELRPAMDRLLRATGDVAQSQQLLNLALDVAAGTGKSVTQVSQSLQKAYLGQTQALGRLGVGLSKAELSSSSFEQIQQRLTELFAGQAAAAADTFAGQLDKLTIAANNAKETIGKGLYDAITALSGGGATSATDNIDKLASGIADTLSNAGELIGKLEKLKPALIAIGLVAAAAFLPMTTAIAGAIFLMGTLNKALDKQSFAKGVIPGGMGKVSMTVSGQVDNTVLKTQTKVTKLTKEQAAAQAKILKDKKLALAIDKANIALGKGENVFDIDKIQFAAALTNQAELLGKATNAAQVLQIANDTARLNVKKSILALEDAIASKDEAAITAATKKLNEDLKILGVLSGQNVKLQDIKSILESLKPKDLINLANLDAAIAKMMELLKLQGTKTLVPTIPTPIVPTTPSPIVPITPPTTVDPIVSSLIDLRKGTETGTAINFLLKEHIDEIIANSSSSMVDEQSQLAMMRILGRTGITADSTFDPARFRARDNGDVINITIQANTIANPEELTNLVQNSLIQLNKRGDLLTTAGAL